jgi:hypothetical protein
MNTAHTISPEQAEQLLQARRSIRRYRDKLVPRESLTGARNASLAQGHYHGNVTS